MDNTNTENSTPMDDEAVAVDSRTEEELLADIVSASAFTDTLPEEQVPELDTEESDEEDPDESEEAEIEDDEEEDEEVEEEAEDEDDEESTQEADVYSQDEIDLDAQVVVKIDGEEMAVSFAELIKGYQTEQHLSNKGRELGDARKQLDEEIQSKIEELNNMSKASADILYSTEKQHAEEYHKLEEAIEKARDEGDTYEVNNLKDQREQAQKKYWNARNKREELVDKIQKQETETQEKVFKEQLEYFNEKIPSMIPDFDQDVAMSIREFAIEEGINPELLDTVVDPVLIKFVDDYRRLKQGVKKGTSKRKSVSVKKAPVRRAKSKKQKEMTRAEQVRQRAFADNASQDEQMDFLRGLANRSLSNI